MKTLIALMIFSIASFSQAETCTTSIAKGFKIIYQAESNANSGAKEISKAQLVFGNDALPLVSQRTTHKNQIVLSYETSALTIDIGLLKTSREFNGHLVTDNEVSVVGMTEPDMAEPGDMICQF